ncbi:hypothetical protein RvY_09661 [Ramazzottius varieornatus]|uniref:Uncharacterized protein n=1 Tax=Ramazzottius varieornatus TaxID=947166 RepID=A0A1D1VFH8_RAMVA|nr:hypothetical protein RvY_09661 [Ramazzottius varieornatus]
MATLSILISIYRTAIHHSLVDNNAPLSSHNINTLSVHALHGLTGRFATRRPTPPRAQQASELAGTASAGWSYDGDPPRTPFDARSFSIPSTPSSTACQAQSGSPEGAGTSHKADERVAYPGPPSVIVKRGTATSSSAALDQIDHGTVSLSCIQPSVASIETDPGSPQREKIRVDVDSEDDPELMTSTPAEGAEVIARIASQGEGASSALMPSADSYQANMVFLVPQ